jgi:hypothetical protein
LIGVLRRFSNISAILRRSPKGHSNVFICFASENPKTYQPAREKNKQEKTVFDNQNVTHQ